MAWLFLIGAVYVLPFTVTVTLPVASFNPVTITFASSPTVIGWADALIVKFSFGLGLTVILTVVDAGLYFSSPLKLTLALTLSFKPVTTIFAVPLLILPVHLLLPIVTVTSPVASFKPVTITLASSPTVIGFAVASIVKFSLGGIGFSLTVTLTLVEFNAYTPSPPTVAVIIALPSAFAVTLPSASTVATDSLLEV